MNTLDYKKQFVENLKETGEYWLNYENKGKEKVLNGALFSTLVLIDGDSGANDFHTLSLIDTKLGKEVTCGYLHEYLSPDLAGQNQFVEDLKSIRDFWINSPDISIQQALEGMLTYVCEYLAGQFELNEYTTFEVVEYIDDDKFVKWDCSNLHEIYTELQDITKLNKGDLN